MDWFRRYASYSGRAPRLEYWRTSLAVGVAAALLAMVAMLGIMGVGAIGGVLFLAVLPLIWISVAIAIRRLHDRGKSASWLFVYWLAPGLLSGWTKGLTTGSPLYWLGLAADLLSIGLSIWAFVELGCLRGTRGPNRYGDDPLQPAAEVFA